MAQTALLVGTHKGGFLLTANAQRTVWDLKGPFLKGFDVNHLQLDTRRAPVIYACANNSWFGSGLRISRDMGDTWDEPALGPAFDGDGSAAVEKLWFVLPGIPSESSTLYCGVAPAALFRSDDAGQTWMELRALRHHETRAQWAPGLGGLMVHSLCLDPGHPERMWVGISAAGTFYTEDGGQTWSPRNKNVRADFLPHTQPAVGQCVHQMCNHPSRPDLMYQQNHCGMYRSDDGGLNWTELRDGLPSDFGFPILVHPRDPDTVYVIPEESAEFRCPVDGDFAVYRSRDRGAHWEKRSEGLPARPAYLSVYRQGMCADAHAAPGLYIGTSTGQIYYSLDDGDSWRLLWDHLPPILAISVGLV